VRGKDGIAQNSEDLKRRDLPLSGTSLLAASALSGAYFATSTQSTDAANWAVTPSGLQAAERNPNMQQKYRGALQSITAGTLVLSTSVLALTVGSALAQQTTGVPGSPNATTTIDGKYLPPPPPTFGGVINLGAEQSKPFWPPTVVPPKGAPNVLLIMTDDQGYGVSGTFGGVIPTPSMDRIAKAGLRYTQFCSTALCSPSRAALITGRNHHSVGYGQIGELATGYPGYNSIIGPDNATIGAILKQNGYATSWFGKEHNTPSFQYSAAGPFDQWPVGMGFEYFYGFMGGETDQWTPYLFRNQTQIFPWVASPATTSPRTWPTKPSSTWES
jgi:hypothetical protein